MKKLKLIYQQLPSLLLMIMAFLWSVRAPCVENIADLPAQVIENSVKPAFVERDAMKSLEHLYLAVKRSSKNPAVSIGNEEIVDVLVSAGADASISATDGKTIEDIARRSHHEKLLQIIK